MKAAVINQFGKPEEVIEITQVDKPSPKEDEVLVKVMATTINDYDWSLVRGKPYIYRLMYGFFKPKSNIPGMELSGIVEDVGEDVKELKIGDEVYGDISEYGFGTFAEYVCIHENALLKKPQEISFVEAAAVPHALGLAVQSLIEVGKISKGQKVLINGGGGGVGALGLQLAKLYNCNVTGVDSTDKLEAMRTLGYDSVIDYKRNNFTKLKEKYDLILDCKTKHFALSYLKPLKSNGKYISIGGNLICILSLVSLTKLVSLFTSKQIKLILLKPNAGLGNFKYDQIKTVIDGPYLLEDIPRLVQYFGEAKHKGKVVIKLHE